MNKPIDGNQKTKNLDLDRYLINLIVDNSRTVGAPVIVETNPTYNNLIGRIDRIPQMDTAGTIFSAVDEKLKLMAELKTNKKKDNENNNS